jgi:hypothetical protein
MTTLRTYLKQVTLTDDSKIFSIDAYIDTDAVNANSIACWILEDNAGVPGNLVVPGTFYAGNPFFLASSGAPRWYVLPISAHLPAGDYWICIMKPDANGVMALAYDTGGSDPIQTQLGKWASDGNSPTPSDSTRTYSVRLSIGSLLASSTEFPKRATMWHQDSLVLAGNAITTDIDNTFYHGLRGYQDSPALNDEFTNGFMSDVGTYSLVFYAHTGNNRGILTVYIDGISQGTVDFYTAGIVVQKLTLSVTVLTSGWHVLRGVVASKHASSSSYYVVMNEMALIPSAD